MDSIIAGNRIDGFAADGLRGFGAREIFRDNIVQNCVTIDGNHPDGFQSFSGATVTGLILERNFFLEWTNAPRIRCAAECRASACSTAFLKI